MLLTMKRRAIKKAKSQNPQPKYNRNHRSMRGYMAWPLKKQDALRTFAFSKKGCITKTEALMPHGLTMEQYGVSPTKCQVIIKLFNPKES